MVVLTKLCGITGEMVQACVALGATSGDHELIETEFIIATLVQKKTKMYLEPLYMHVVCILNLYMCFAEIF